MSESTFPTDRSYTDEHEWILVAPGEAMPTDPLRIGITSVAVQELGELVFLDLPEVGTTIAVGQPCGEVESTKTVSEIYPPVNGEVVELNTAAIDEPGLVNADPYGAGWLFTVRASTSGELLTAAEYAAKNGFAADGTAL